MFRIPPRDGGFPSPEPSPEPEGPKKRWKVVLEMEGYGKDGTEYTGNDLYEEVEVEATNEDNAEEAAFEMDFGNRRPSGVSSIEEVRS